MATAHPPCTGPTTLSSGMRAPSKKTSLKSLPPVSMRIGRTSTPGVSIGHSRNEMPRCLGAVGSVRASTKIQLARVANEVQIFCPSITQSSPSSTARVPRLARSEPAFGSEKPWHHVSSPERIRGRNRRFCSSVPHFSSVLPTIFTVTVSLAGTERHHRPGALLHQHDLLALAHPAAAVLGRPGQTEQAVLVQRAAPAGR